MIYAALFAFVMGLLAGSLCVFLILKGIRVALRKQKQSQDAQAARIRETVASIKARQLKLDDEAARLDEQKQEFETRCISYKELNTENTILKRDLQNVDVNLRKLELDRQLQREEQEALDKRGQELGSRYLKENVKWLSSSLTANNYAACKQRLQKVAERCRGIGYAVSKEEETALLADLKEEFEKKVRADFEREEQARIKAQIREEQRLEREIQRELQQLERERAAIQAALEKAIAEAKEEHSEEVERLKGRLAEAEAKSQRAMSRAQMTKSGHVYIISNIGSFGEGVYKIGMTRRLEPIDRVRELGDASVPFPFDVHMMISCDDAPSLENAIHRALHKVRLNRIKPRKEFFRTNIDTVRGIVEKHHGEVQYVADAEALEYRQSLSMSDEDSEYVEQVYESLEDEKQTATSED